ncbi:MAG: tRNA (adenosine(37)-N6)-dimethylallyltransferase MiaA [Lachnospiraceae bacterium]|nr:tRNA (adenosine(37)-N6)-dimethylallyltransferase MiaA [Lachnospiraceae bacterium]
MIRIENQSEENRIPLIVIEGPTSAGKSDIAVLVAKALDGEIISADSMQVYREMDIGTGKIRPEEMGGIPHFLLDIADPEDAFDLARFKEAAKEAVLDVWRRGKIPVLCGGTGFYIQAVVKDIDFSSASPSEEYRRELEEFAEREGNDALHAILREKDPDAAAAIHPNNRKRVIRALEFLHETGGKISEKNRSDKEQPSPYDAMIFFIDMDRAELYQKIEKRVDLMLEAGLVEEVRTLKERGLTRNDVSMQGLGYKEILAYLEGETSLEEAVRILKRDTRHFAKRQLTWFRHDREAVRIAREDYGNDAVKIAEAVAGMIREHYGETIYKTGK